MNGFALRLSLLVGLGVAVVGCGDSESGGGCPNGQVECDGVCIDEIEPTLRSIQAEVFSISCSTASTCHDANGPEQGLDLSSLAASEASLIDVDSTQVPTKVRVAPGDSSASYLMNKLLGVDIPLGTTRMPQLDPDGLCAPKIDAIEQWIDDGAPVE
jgi:hypothetical protein